jgi:hypothetical protein
MTREPIIESGTVIWHKVTAEAVGIIVRDDRGCEPIILIHPRETVVEPLAR